MSCTFSLAHSGFWDSVFLTEHVNLGLIRYVLYEEKIQKVMDSFQFLVKDSKPNVVSDNVFHIQWSLISFKYTSYNVSEKAGSVSVTVQRTGNLNQYAIVLCRTEQGTASSSSHPGQQDYMEYAGQVGMEGPLVPQHGRRLWWCSLLMHVSSCQHLPQESAL